MNKLARPQRIQVLTLLCEGMSLRATSRATGVSYNTVCALLADAGPACAAFHDDVVRNVQAKRLQADEIWSFCYARQRNVVTVKATPADPGDLWIWLVLDADSKLIVSYHCGGQDAGYAHEVIQDAASRIANRVQLTTDGHKAYLTAVEDACGANVDYDQLVKLFSDAPHPPGRYSPAECTGIRKTRIEGRPDEKHISTSYVERQNLNLRMGIGRFTRLTNRFSKSADAHYNMLSLYVTFHNFCRDPKTHRCAPAEAAGLVKSAMTIGDIVDLVDARAEPPKKRGPYKPRQSKA